MADNKKTFIAYCDWETIFSSLPDEYAGKLAKHLFAYVNDKNPSEDDVLIKVSFSIIKQRLKVDLKNWEAESEAKRLGGLLGNLKRWNKDLYQQVMDKKITIIDAEKIASGRIATVSDTERRIPSHTVASVADNENEFVNVSSNHNSIEELNTVESRDTRNPQDFVGDQQDSVDEEQDDSVSPEVRSKRALEFFRRVNGLNTNPTPMHAFVDHTNVNPYPLGSDDDYPNTVDDNPSRLLKKAN